MQWNWQWKFAHCGERDSSPGRSVLLGMRALLVLATVIALAQPAWAQYVPMDFSSQTFNSMNLSSSYVLSSSMLRSSARGGSRARAARVRTARVDPVSTVTTGGSGAIRSLAAAYPRAKRGEVEGNLRTLLAGFSKLEDAVGVPSGDAAGAMAALIIGSYTVLHGEIPDEHVQTVIAQLRGAMRVDPRFVRMKMTQRRELYEKLAIVSMMVMGTHFALSQRPDPAMAARLHDAAEAYLEELSLDPERLVIDASGLSLASS